MASGISRRAYARHRGVSEAAVRKALSAGRIALGADGKIDPEVADEQWAANTAGVGGRNSPTPADNTAALHPVSKQAVDSVTKTLAEAGQSVGDQGDDDDGGLNGAGVTLTDARKAKTIAETHLTRLKVQEMRRRLVDREQAESFAFELARQQRDAWISWPARIASQFAADIAALETIEQRGVHALLEQYVHEHLEELGKLQSRQLA